MVGLVFLVVAVLAGIILVQQNQDIREEAATGCQYKTNCEGCGGTKSNGQSFKCKLIKGKCAESGELCDGGGGGGSLPDTCGGTCINSGAYCPRSVTMTRDCMNQYPAKYCCPPAIGGPIASLNPAPTTHYSICTHGASVTQICGVGWIHGQILTPCVKKQTKVCVYGNWEVRSRCGESNPSCL